MSTAPARDLAEDLTARILSLEGVRGIFPDHAIAAAVLTVVKASNAASGLVQIDSDGTKLRIVARLATDRTVPSPVLTEQVVAITDELVSPLLFSLTIEYAHIE